jgi:hypothetical protein
VTISIIKVGGWAHEDILEASEMNDFQDELIKAIDGVDGGSYDPSSHITFGGATGEIRFDYRLRLRSGGELLTDSGSQSDFSGQVDFFNNVDFRETSTVEFIAGGLVEFHDGTRVVVEELDDLEVDNQSCIMRMHNSWGQSTWNSTEPYWEMDEGVWIQLANTSGAALYFALPVMEGDDIAELGVTVTGGVGSGHSALPAGMPRVRILEADSTGLYTTVVAELTDPTAVVATYDAAHVIALDNASTTGDLPYTAIDRNYIVEVRGEFGLDSEPDELQVQRLQAVITRRRLVAQNVFGA